MQFFFILIHYFQSLIIVEKSSILGIQGSQIGLWKYETIQANELSSIPLEINKKSESPSNAPSESIKEPKASDN